MVKKELKFIGRKIKKEREKLEEVRKDVRELIQKESGSVEKEFKKNLTTAVTAAFAFVIALAWKDVITQSVDYLIAFSHLPQGQAFGFRIVSAIAVTFICVIGIMLTVRFVGKKSGEEEEGKKKKSAESGGKSGQGREKEQMGK
ncbi:MAG TPA: hypothetical protein HA282_04775 [Nanoarchaeota archaeon]|nr:hypothetical protein [Candidatus Pacearchaeota archaeon]HIH17936.1 hypothetical protein [Nanoarchaeota archaeon]HIH33999.1 hypothetical protein [Nanoarchaeota archaeon]HIH51062.1 hypothetical protein [Nanoarchaeota archaeon]HIH66496.1 hypothetical protein [Nanoarchaeota archaeon]